MRKFAILTLFLLLLTACRKTDETALIFDSVTADESVKLSNDEASPSCNVHIQMHYATDENGDRAQIVNNIIEKRLLNMSDLPFAHAVDSFASHYTQSYQKNLLPMYNQDRADESKRKWYEYHYIIDTETVVGRRNTTVYTANIDYYEGGAHSISQCVILNFVNKSGHLLDLEDIFMPGYEQSLNDRLREALCEKVNVRNVRELHNKGYLFSMDIFPATNFIINDETITFVYNPYEIASYDKGSTELTLALADLRTILRPEFIP